MEQFKLEKIISELFISCVDLNGKNVYLASDQMGYMLPKEEIKLAIQELENAYRNYDLIQLIQSYEKEVKKGEEKRQKEIDRRGFVYLLKANGIYKIGKTKNVRHRLQQIKSHNPDVKLIRFKYFFNANKIEGCLLNKFKDKNISGEWFDLSKDEFEEVFKFLGRE